jgi:hypothetical protein
VTFWVLLHQFKCSFSARIWNIINSVKFSVRNCENLKAILRTISGKFLPYSLRIIVVCDGLASTRHIKVPSIFNSPSSQHCKQYLCTQQFQRSYLVAELLCVINNVFLNHRLKHSITLSRYFSIIRSFKCAFVCSPKRAAGCICRPTVPEPHSVGTRFKCGPGYWLETVHNRLLSTSRCEVLTAVMLKIPFFWHISPCRLVKSCRFFESTKFLHIS